MNKRIIAAQFFSLLLITAAGPANADQTLKDSSRPITLVVPTSPGSSSDVMARILGKGITEKAGNPTIVENRPGANGIIGVQNILNQQPNGHTLLFTTSSPIVFNKFLYKKLPYDPQRDLVPIMIFARGTMMLGISPKLPYANLTGLVDAAKKNPGKLNFGYATATQQLVGELFQKASGTQFTFVAYKTNAAMLQAVITGEIDFAISDPAGFEAFIQSKKINVVAATSQARLKAHPDIPTLNESGIDLTLETFNGVFARKGTSNANREALINILKDQARSPDMQAYSDANSMDDFVALGSDAQKYVDTMLSKWTGLTRDAGIVAQQ